LQKTPELNSSTKDEPIDYLFSFYQKEKDSKIEFASMAL
jgi:hypothetical protein